MGKNVSQRNCLRSFQSVKTFQKERLIGHWDGKEESPWAGWLSLSGWKIGGEMLR